MKKFLKDNIVLVLGISLPVVLVVVFMVAAAVPRWLVADPGYDFIFSDETYGAITFVVKGEKVHFEVAPARVGVDNQAPRLYRYVAATGKVEKIAFTPPDLSGQKVADGSGADTNIVIPLDPKNLPTAEQAQDASRIAAEMKKPGYAEPLIVPVAELAKVKVSDAVVAPDGYEMISDTRSYGGGVFLLGFGSSYRARGPVLAKNGKHVAIEYDSARDTYYRTPRFVGWVIP